MIACSSRLRKNAGMQRRRSVTKLSSDNIVRCILHGFAAQYETDSSSVSGIPSIVDRSSAGKKHSMIPGRTDFENRQRSLRNLRLAVRGLGMHEWLGSEESVAVYASAGQVERRCNCDAPNAECAWTQQGSEQSRSAKQLPRTGNQLLDLDPRPPVTGTRRAHRHSRLQMDVATRELDRIDGTRCQRLL